MPGLVRLQPFADGPPRWYARRGSVLLAGTRRSRCSRGSGNRTKPRSASSGRAWRKSEELRSFGDRRIAELQRPDLCDRQRRDAAVEERVVRPQRLVDRPPTDPGSAGIPVDGERLRLRDRSVARRDPAGTKSAAPELAGSSRSTSSAPSGSSSAASASGRRRRTSIGSISRWPRNRASCSTTPETSRSVR